MKKQLKKYLSMLLAFVMVCSCFPAMPMEAEETESIESSTTHTWDFSDAAQADDFDIVSNMATNQLSIENECLTTNASSGAYMKAVLKEDYNVGEVSVDIYPVYEDATDLTTAKKLDSHILLGVTGTTQSIPTANEMIDIRWEDSNTELDTMLLTVAQVTDGTKNIIAELWCGSGAGLYDTKYPQPVHMNVEVVNTRLIITISLLNDSSMSKSLTVDLTKDVIFKTGETAPEEGFSYTNLNASRVQGRVGFAVDNYNGGCAAFDNLVIDEELNYEEDCWDFEYDWQADDFTFTTDNSSAGNFSIVDGYLTHGETLGFKNVFSKKSYINPKSISVDVYPLQDNNGVNTHLNTFIYFGLGDDDFTGNGYKDTFRLQWNDRDNSSSTNKILQLVHFDENKNNSGSIVHGWTEINTAGNLYDSVTTQPVNIKIEFVATTIMITVTVIGTSEYAGNSITISKDISTLGYVKTDLNGRIGFGSTYWTDNLSGNTGRAKFDNLKITTYDTQTDKGGYDFTTGDMWETKEGLPSSPNTIEAWIKIPSDINNDKTGVILSAQPEIPSIDLRMSTYGRPCFTWRDANGTSQKVIVENVDLRTGKWTHVAVVRDVDESKFVFYINGEVVKEVTDVTVEDIDIWKLYVGRNDARTSWPVDGSTKDQQRFPGKIADIRVWSSSLNQSEVQTSMSQDTMEQSAELLMNASLDNLNTDNSFTDASQYNNTIIAQDNTLEWLDGTEEYYTWDFSEESQADDFTYTTDSSSAGNFSIVDGYMTHGDALGFKNAFSNNSFKNFKSLSVDVYPLQDDDTANHFNTNIYFGLGEDDFTGSGFKNTFRLNWSDRDNTSSTNKILYLYYYNADGNKTDVVHGWNEINKVGNLYDSVTPQPVNITINVDNTFITITLTVLGTSEYAGNSITISKDISTLGYTKEVLNGRVGFGSTYWTDNLTGYNSQKNTGRAKFDNLKIMTYDPQMEEEDFSVVVIPDQQVLSRYQPDKLNSLYQWIAANAETENIKYVLNLGDLADSGVKEEVLKANMEASKNAYDIIAAKNIPMALVPGNHDYNENTGYRNTEVLNSYFNTTNGYGTNENITYMTEGEVENSYHTFTANEGTMFEQKYLIVALEYGARDSVIAWADKVIQEHADYQVIVMTHGYLNYDGTLLNSATRHAASHSSYLKTEGEEAPNDADALWTKLISKHGNIIMVLSGHIGTDDVVVRTDKGVNGNDVVQMLVDGQHRDAENECQGVGLLGLMRFDGTSGEMTFKYFSPLQGEDGNTMKYLGTSNQFDLTLPVQDGRLVVNGLATRTVLNIKDQANLPTGYVDDKFIINWTLNGEEVDVFDESQNGYTPNFADPEMLDVCYQTNEAIAQAGTDKYNIRFISSLNAYEDYEEAGFLFMSDTKYTKDAVIEINADNTAKVSTKKLYTSLLASGNTVSAVDYYGNDYQQYFFTFEMTGIPAEKALYVRAYVKLNSGEILYGDVKCITAPAVKAQ